MDKALYIAMTGATQNMAAQVVHANNLANASTNGFRADMAQARSMQVYGEGYPTRVYAMTEVPGTDFSQGPSKQTAGELDIAIAGDGWIAVESADGSEAYTRSGELKLNQFGELTTNNGMLVLGNDGPILIPPYETLEIGSDGTISIREQGQEAETIAALDRIRLVNPANRDLFKGADGLFRRIDGAQEFPDASVVVISGYLEGSNVNVVDAMVEMISLARTYEMNIKLIQTAEQNSEAAALLLQVQ